MRASGAPARSRRPLPRRLSSGPIGRETWASPERQRGPRPVSQSRAPSPGPKGAPSGRKRAPSGDPSRVRVYARNISLYRDKPIRPLRGQACHVCLCRARYGTKAGILLPAARPTRRKAARPSISAPFSPRPPRANRLNKPSARGKFPKTRKSMVTYMRGPFRRTVEGLSTHCFGMVS